MQNTCGRTTRKRSSRSIPAPSSDHGLRFHFYSRFHSIFYFCSIHVVYADPLLSSACTFFLILFSPFIFTERVRSPSVNNASMSVFAYHYPPFFSTHTHTSHNRHILHTSIEVF